MTYRIECLDARLRYRQLGPGLLESTYEQCLAYELNQTGILFKIQQPLPVAYKEIKLECGYRVDLFVDDRLIIELKSVEQLLKIHEAQLLTYMKLANVRIGLLSNFNVQMLKKGDQKICFLISWQILRGLREFRGENVRWRVAR